MKIKHQISISVVATSIGKSSNDLSQIASQIRGQLQQFRFGN
ncbi:hypothetical protein [Thalassolituus sp.]